MKIAALLCASCVCLSSVLEASAVAAPERGVSPTPMAAAGQAAGAPRSGGNAGAPLGRAEAGESILDHRTTGIGSKGLTRGTPGTRTRALGPHARTNGDRLHSPLSAKAQGRVARQPSQAGPSRAAAQGGGGLPGVGATPRMQYSVPPPSQRAARTPISLNRATRAPINQNSAARAPINLNPAARASRIGGPLMSRQGALGVPQVGRSAPTFALDGTQLRRKF